MATRSREVRLGVVMFGGVSLAVYINGVSQELYRAVRGRGVYRLLKALTDSEIVVDILSGASAGGINSVLLSAALCNDTDFGTTAKLWRESADIEALLSMPSARVRDAAESEPPKDSVLDGAFHHRQLRAALSELLGPPTPSNEKEDVSELSELDLFVTATDIDGQKSRWVDALGQSIQLEDHRSLFRLKHRVGRNTPFAAQAAADGSPQGQPLERRQNLEALTTLSHITSCFPGAFVPVKVTVPAQPELAVRGPIGTLAEGVDARLSYWGALRPFQDEQGQLWSRQAIFMDGGVLKNKPFTSTIQAIFSRLADRQVRRYMLYVDPDPNEVSGRPSHPDVDDPGRRLWPVAVAAASGLPRFESIDGDLAQAEMHNQQLRRYEAVLKEATVAALADPRVVSNPETPSARAHRRARVAGLSAAVLGSVAGRRASAENAVPGQRPPRAELSRLIDGLCQRPASRLQELFDEFDVLFGFRRLIHLTYTVDDEAPVEPPTGPRRLWVALPREAEKLESYPIDCALLEAINRQIELYEVVRARLEDELQQFAPTSKAEWGDPQFWSEFAERARAVLRRLPRPRCFAGSALGISAGRVTPEELSALRVPRPNVVDLRPPKAEAGFLQEAQAFERRLLEGTKLRDLYDCFPQIDEVAYPLELLSELRGRDQIRTVRISPLDTKRGFAGEFTNKLCGRQLGAFGAFFKASFRANDLMWGRLDGVSQLLELLLDAKRLAALPSGLLESNLQEVLGQAWDLRAIFPHSPAADRRLLEGWLREVSCGDQTRARLAREALDDESGFRELWARAAQLEILVDELPRVLQLAADEALGQEKATLHAQSTALRANSPVEVGAAVATHFSPSRYRIAEQRLPDALPPGRVNAIVSEASAHLKEALLSSLPSGTFRESAVRGAANVLLSAALWLVTTLWTHGKLGRR